MRFDRTDMGYRRLLALAIRDYLNNPLNTLDGKKDGKRKTLRTLRDEMSEAGFAVTESTLSRLQFPAPADESGSSYPRDAKRVAEYLETRDFYPPDRSVADTLKILPIFFGGFIETAAQMLEDAEGVYTVYQVSNRQSDHLIASRLEIGPMTEWRFANVREEVVYWGAGSNALRYAGAAFSDENRTLFILSREERHRYPRLYVMDDCNVPDGSDEIESIYGMVLGGGRRHARHFSPVAFMRGDDPLPEELIPIASLESSVPRPVAQYFGQEHRPGPGRY